MSQATNKTYLLEKVCQKTHNDLEFDTSWSSKATGLPCTIFTACSDDFSFPQVKAGHKTNIDIDTETITFTIEDNPKIISNYTELPDNLISNIKKWIILNKKLLLDFWDWKITVNKFYKSIKRI